MRDYINDGSDMILTAKDNLTDKELKEWKKSAKKIWSKSLVLSSEENKETSEIYNQCIDFLIKFEGYKKTEATLIINHKDVAEYYLDSIAARHGSIYDIVQYFLELNEGVVKCLQEMKK